MGKPAENQNVENTITSYLGKEFQNKLFWQLLTEPEFAEKVMPDLCVEYFDDPNLRRLFIIMTEYFNELGRIPSLLNDSIQTAIHKYKTPNNKIDEDQLFSTVNQFVLWNTSIINGARPYDGDVVRQETTAFIKQQEYRKLSEFIQTKVRGGEISKKNMLGVIEEKITKISRIGDTEDMGTEVGEGVEHALRKEFRETILTGVAVIDELTGGGLGKGEIGLILTASGVGKSTILTKIANTGYELGKNVLQIIFEDTEDQIKRKHYTIWSKIPLSEIDERRDAVNKIAHEKLEELKRKGGQLIIKKFSQENTSIMSIRSWIDKHEKKFGYKFEEIVLDYLDCLESHKQTPDRNEAELIIVKSFLALASDLNVPCWSALQGNRGSFSSKFLDVHDMGGSIKRVQKSHFFMSVAKPDNMKDGKLANVKIIKARFAKDGQLFIDSRFDNDYLDIRLNDADYDFMYSKDHPEASLTNFQAINHLGKKSKKKIVDEPEISPEIQEIFDKRAKNAIESNKSFDEPETSTYNNIHTCISEKKSGDYDIDISDMTSFPKTPENIAEIKKLKEESEFEIKMKSEIINHSNSGFKLKDITYPDGEVIITTTTTKVPEENIEQTVKSFDEIIENNDNQTASLKDNVLDVPIEKVVNVEENKIKKQHPTIKKKYGRESETNIADNVKPLPIKNSKSKISEDEEDLIMELYLHGMKPINIQHAFSISYENVLKIIKKKKNSSDEIKPEKPTNNIEESIMENKSSNPSITLDVNEIIKKFKNSIE